jgi:hypothetical protein
MYNAHVKRKNKIPAQILVKKLFMQSKINLNKQCHYWTKEKPNQNAER